MNPVPQRGTRTERKLEKENTAEKSYLKESVAKRRMITDTAWEKIYGYAREGCIRHCHGRRVIYSRSKLADFICHSGLFILVNTLICADCRRYNGRLITGQGSD